MTSLADACGGQPHLPRFHFAQSGTNSGTSSIGLLSEGLVHATILLSNPQLTTTTTTTTTTSGAVPDVKTTPTSPVVGGDENADGVGSSSAQQFPSSTPSSPPSPTTMTTTARLSDHLYRHIISYSPMMYAKKTDGGGNDDASTSGPLMPLSLCFRFPGIIFGGMDPTLDPSTTTTTTTTTNSSQPSSSMDAFSRFVSEIWTRHAESKAAVAATLKPEEVLLLERPYLVIHDASKLDAITADVVFPIYNIDPSPKGLPSRQRQHRPQWISLQSSLLRQRDNTTTMCRVRPSRPFYDPSGQLIQFLTQRRRDDMSRMSNTPAASATTPPSSPSVSTMGLQFRGVIVQVLRGDVYGVRIHSITPHHPTTTPSSYFQVGKVVQVHLASVECYNRFGDQDHHAASPPLYSLEDTSAAMVSESWERGFASELIHRHKSSTSSSNSTDDDIATTPSQSPISLRVPEDNYRLPAQTPVVIADANAGYESYWFAKRHLFGMDVRCVVSYCKPSDKDVSNNTQLSEYSQHEHVCAHVEVLGRCGSITTTSDKEEHEHDEDKQLSPLLQQIVRLKQRRGDNNDDDGGIGRRFKALNIAHTTAIIDDEDHTTTNHNSVYAIPVAPLLLAFGVAKVASCTMERDGSGTHALLAQPLTIPDHPSPYHHAGGGDNIISSQSSFSSLSTFNNESSSCEYIQVLQMLHAIIAEDRDCRVALLKQEIGLFDNINGTLSSSAASKINGLLQRAVQLPTHLQVLQRYVMHGDRSQTRCYDNIQYYLDADTTGSTNTSSAAGSAVPTEELSPSARPPHLDLKGLFGNWSRFPWGTHLTIWPPAAHTKHSKPMPGQTTWAGRMAADREAVLESSKINDTLSKSMFVVICQRMVRLSISRTIKAVLTSMGDDALRSVDVRWVSRLLLRPTASQNALAKSITPLYLYYSRTTSRRVVVEVKSVTSADDANYSAVPISVSTNIGCFLLGSGSMASIHGTPSYLAQYLGASLLFLSTSSSSSSSSSSNCCPMELLNLSEMLLESTTSTTTTSSSSTLIDQYRIHLLPRLMGMYYQDVCPLIHTNSHHLSLTVNTMMAMLQPSSSSSSLVVAGTGATTTVTISLIHTINTRKIFGDSLVVVDDRRNTSDDYMGVFDGCEDADDQDAMRRLVLRASSSCRVTSSNNNNNHNNNIMGATNRVPTLMPLKMVLSLKCLVGCGTAFPGYVSNIIDVDYLPREGGMLRYVVEFTIVAQGAFLQWLVSRQRSPTTNGGSGGWGRTAMIQDSGALSIEPSNTTRDFSLRFNTARAKDVVDIGVGLEEMEVLKEKREQLRDASDAIGSDIVNTGRLKQERRNIEVEAKRAAIMKNNAISIEERNEALWCLDVLNSKRQFPVVTPLTCTQASNPKTLVLSYNASDSFGRGTTVKYGQPPPTATLTSVSNGEDAESPTATTTTITSTTGAPGVSSSPTVATATTAPPVTSSPLSTSAYVYLWMEVSMNEFYEDYADAVSARDAFSWRYNNPALKTPKRIRSILTGKIDRQNVLVDIELPKPKEGSGKFMYVVVDISVFEQSGGKKDLVKQQRVLYELTDNDIHNGTCFDSNNTFISTMHIAAATAKLTTNVDEEDDDHAVMYKGDAAEDGADSMDYPTTSSSEQQHHVSPPSIGSGSSVSASIEASPSSSPTTTTTPHHCSKALLRDVVALLEAGTSHSSGSATTTTTTTSKLLDLMRATLGCSVADAASAVGHLGILSTVHVSNTIALPNKSTTTTTVTNDVIMLMKSKIKRLLRESLLYTPASLHPEGLVSEQGDFTEAASSVAGNIYISHPIIMNTTQQQKHQVVSMKECVSKVVVQHCCGISTHADPHPTPHSSASEPSSQLTSHYTHLKKAMCEDMIELGNKKASVGSTTTVGVSSSVIDLLPRTTTAIESFTPVQSPSSNSNSANNSSPLLTTTTTTTSAPPSWIVSAKSPRAYTLLLPQMDPLHFPVGDYTVSPTPVAVPQQTIGVNITHVPLSLSLQAATSTTNPATSTQASLSKSELVRVEIASYFLAATALFPRMFAACHRKHHLSIMTKDVENKVRGEGHIDYIFNRMTMPTLRNILTFDYSSIGAGGALPTHLTRDPLLLAANPHKAACLFNSPPSSSSPDQVPTTTTSTDVPPCSEEPILRAGVEQFVSDVRPLSGLLSTLMFALPRAWPNMVEADSGRKLREARGNIHGIYRSSRDAIALRDNTAATTTNADLEDKRAYFEATREECFELRQQLLDGGYTISNKMCPEVIVAALLPDEQMTSNTDDVDDNMLSNIIYPSTLLPPAPLPHQLLCQCPSLFYKRGISNISISSDEKKSGENYTLLASDMRTSGIVEIVRVVGEKPSTQTAASDTVDKQPSTTHNQDNGNGAYLVYKYPPTFHTQQLMESGSDAQGLTIGQVPVYAASSTSTSTPTKAESISYCARLQLTPKIATKLVTAIGVAALTRTTATSTSQPQTTTSDNNTIITDYCCHRVDGYSNELMGYQGEGVDEGPAQPHVAYRMNGSGTVFGDPLSSPPPPPSSNIQNIQNSTVAVNNTIFDPLSTARVSVVYVPLRLRSSITPHSLTKHSSIGQMRRDTIFALLLSGRRKGREMLDLCKLWLQTRPSDVDGIVDYSAFGDGKLTFYGSSMEPLYVYYRSRDMMRHALSVTWSGSLFPLDTSAAEASYNLVLTNMARGGGGPIQTSSSSSSPSSSFLTSMAGVSARVSSFPQVGDDVKDYVSTVGDAFSPVATEVAIGILPPTVNCWEYFSRLFGKYHIAASNYNSNTQNNNNNASAATAASSSPCGDRLLWARAEEAATRQLLLDTITTITSIATIRATQYTAKGSLINNNNKNNTLRRRSSSSTSSSSGDDDDGDATTTTSSSSVVPPAIYLATASRQEENTVRINAYVVEDGCYDDNGNYTGSFLMDGNVRGRLVSLRFTLTSLPMMLLRELSIEACTVERLESMGSVKAGLVSNTNNNNDTSNNNNTSPSSSLNDHGRVSDGDGKKDSVGMRYVGEGKAQWEVPLLPQRDAAILLSTATGRLNINNTLSSSKVVGDGSVLPFSIVVEDLRES